MDNDTATIADEEWEGAVPESLRRGAWVRATERSELAAELKERYEQGESIRSLAAATGRSYGFVRGLLTEAGATLRGRGGIPGRS